MNAAYPPGPIEALDAFAEVLVDAEAGTSQDAFYGRLCYVICTLASMDRAVLFRYDDALRRVTVAGTHNLDINLFHDDEVSVESAPIARQALERDAVIEIQSPDPDAVPERYRSLIHGGTLVCVPLAAAGRWIGVALCDRRSGAALDQREQHLLWTLGKTAALASAARIATFEGQRARELQERIDIAREVHERVVQRLFGVSLALDSQGDFPAEARRRAAGEIQHALSELKTVVQQPLGRTPRPTATTLAEEVKRLTRSNTKPRIELHPDSNLEVPAELEPLAQSILREALRNAQKHAQPTLVTVTAGRRDGVFVLEVVNDGVNGSGATQSTGMGLRLAAFEALQVGGFVEFGARDGNKWQVRLVVPTGGD
ncbi:MAG TPA: GAF domain-containing protein [Thermoleophilaceae bacterium]|jgi:signal transduction histidine kinase|nr:GAF domain-containing protein [Thermoleophilaceae bacterium]